MFDENTKESYKLYINTAEYKKLLLWTLSVQLNSLAHIYFCQT